MSYNKLSDFVKPYTVAASNYPNADLVDLENPPPPRGASLPCPAALEFLADIYEKEGGEDQILQATEVGFLCMLTDLTVDLLCSCGGPLRTSMIQSGRSE
jgi:hypothetical protein